MKAAVFHGEKDVRIEEMEDPLPSEGEVLLKPKFCGICGTDLDAWNRGMYAEGVVIGHEFSAEVVRCGPGVTGWSPGDRVVANSIIPCETCHFCREGYFSLCDNLEMPGISTNGGLAELVVLPADILVPIPDTVSYEEAALTEPLAVVLHGFSKIKGPKRTVLVLGAGTLGLLAQQVAIIMGGTFIATSEPNPFRRNLAGTVGITHAIDPVKSNVSVEFEKIAKEAPDLVIECSGSASAASETFSLVKKGGKILVLGISEEPVDADFMTAVLNEITIHFSYCGYAEFPAAATLLATNHIDARSLITSTIHLDDVVEKGFEELMNPDTQNIKILVEL